MLKHILICFVFVIACISFTNAVHPAPLIVPSIASANSDVVPFSIRLDPSLSNITVITSINSTIAIDDTVPVSIASYTYNQATGDIGLGLTQGHLWRQNSLTFSDSFVHTPNATEAYYKVYAPLHRNINQTDFRLSANVSAVYPDGSQYNEIGYVNTSFVPDLAEQLVVHLDVVDNTTVAFNISLQQILIEASHVAIDFDPHSTSIVLSNQSGNNTCTNGAIYTFSSNTRIAFSNLNLTRNSTVDLICPGLVLRQEDNSMIPIDTNDLLVSVSSVDVPYPVINVYFHAQQDDSKINIAKFIIIAIVIAAAVLILVAVSIVLIKKRAQQSAAADAYQPLNVQGQNY